MQSVTIFLNAEAIGRPQICELPSLHATTPLLFWCWRTKVHNFIRKHVWKWKLTPGFHGFYSLHLLIQAHSNVWLWPLILSTKYELYAIKSMPWDAHLKELFGTIIFWHTTHIFLAKIRSQSLTRETKWPCI